MAFQWTHPHWLWLGLVAIPWMVWWHMRTDHVMAKWKRHLILALRLIITLLILLGLAGLQWLRPMEGMNVVYLLDRSESLSADQKQRALSYVSEDNAQNENRGPCRRGCFGRGGSGTSRLTTKCPTSDSIGVEYLPNRPGGCDTTGNGCFFPSQDKNASSSFPTGMKI